MLDDPYGGAPGLVGGQPHVVAHHAEAAHIKAVYLVIAAAVTPVHRWDQKAPDTELSNSWYHRDYLKVSTKPVIPWASLTLAMTLHCSSTWVWVRL